MKKKEVVKGEVLTDKLERIIKEWHSLKRQDTECNIGLSKGQRDKAREVIERNYQDIKRKLGIKDEKRKNKKDL